MKYRIDPQDGIVPIDNQEDKLQLPEPEEDRRADPIWGLRDQYQPPMRTSRSVVSPETKSGDVWPKLGL